MESLEYSDTPSRQFLFCISRNEVIENLSYTLQVSWIQRQQQQQQAAASENEVENRKEVWANGAPQARKKLNELKNGKKIED